MTFKISDTASFYVSVLHIKICCSELHVSNVKMILLEIQADNMQEY